MRQYHASSACRLADLFVAIMKFLALAAAVAFRDSTYLKL